MTKTEALAKIYQTYSQEQLRDAKDEPDTDFEQFLGSDAASIPRYDDVQREFGWDDTH